MNFLSILIVGLLYFSKRNIWNFLVIFVLVAITGIALIQSAQDIGIVDGVWWSGMWQNFATEMIGAILTFALFEMLINANDRQETLMRQMASADNATAVNAANELRALGYLLDGSLYRKSLKLANLSGANLQKANLAQVNLTQANLSSADLDAANLSGANLVDANLLNADLAHTRFDTHTILPDGSNWHPRIDMQVFTHPVETEAEASPLTDEMILLPEESEIEPIEIIHRPQSHPYRALRTKRRQNR